MPKSSFYLTLIAIFEGILKKALMLLSLIILSCDLQRSSNDCHSCDYSVSEKLPGMPPTYQPRDDQVLVFVGQDNASLGANGAYSAGYADDSKLGVPSGVSTYLGFAYPCDPKLPGISDTADWGAGPINMQSYFDSPTYKGAIIHISIDLAFNNSEFPTANGQKDSCIFQITEFMKSHPETFFMVRIGYEFDGNHNDYDRTAFKWSFKRIVEHFIKAELKNFNTVMSSLLMKSSIEQWKAYWPGDEYVHWLGYTYFGGEIPKNPEAIQFAKEKNKPVFIAEASAHGKQLDRLNENASIELWRGWFTDFFDHVERHGDVIKAISYINADWEAQWHWKGKGWGDSRIQVNPVIRKNWILKMTEARYIHDPLLANETIGFSPPQKKRFWD